MPGFLMITLEATLGRSKPSLATMKELRKRLGDRPERKRRGMTTLPFRGANAECKRREISLCAGRRIRRSECGRKSRPAPFEMTGRLLAVGRAGFWNLSLAVEGKLENRRQKAESRKQKAELAKHVG